MLDLKYVRENLAEVAALLKKRGHDFDTSAFEAIDKDRRALISEAEKMKAGKNELSKKIGELKKAKEDAGELMDRVKAMDGQIKSAEEKAAESDRRLWDILARVPNLPSADVPAGVEYEKNLKVRSWGEPAKFSFQPKPHWELGEALGILDWDRAAKLAGARFTVYRGAGAALERALIQLMLDTQTREHGYLEHGVPLMANAESLFGTGQLPKFEEDMFRLRGEQGLYLISTSEIALTNLHRGETLDEAALPLKYTAYTPCFRAEAGAYGRDTRGMVRQHQFNKVELVKITTPDQSSAEHEAMVSDAEAVLRKLELPYQVLLLCGGEAGFCAAKCYDIEVYAAGQEKKWWECSSVSNCTDFQARRMELKVKLKDGKKVFAHTLNGSGLATSRVLPAILENNQQADGSIVIPEVLRPYMGGLDRITPAPAL